MKLAWVAISAPWSHVTDRRSSVGSFAMAVRIAASTFTAERPPSRCRRSTRRVVRSTRAVLEEVLQVDEETGKQRIVQQPKLLVPDIQMRAMSLRDEETNRQFLEALRAAGVPISMSTRLVNVPVDLEDEVERVAEEQIDQVVKAQQVRKETYIRLRDEGLPIPKDLLDDFGPKPQGDHEQDQEAGQEPGRGEGKEEVAPALGTDRPGSTAPLAPTPYDQPADPGGGRPIPAAPRAPGQEGGGARVVTLPKNRMRPPESDEQRAGMPRSGSWHPSQGAQDADEPEVVDGEFGGFATPRHVGMRREVVLDPEQPLDDQLSQPVSDD